MPVPAKPTISRPVFADFPPGEVYDGCPVQADWPAIQMSAGTDTEKARQNFDVLLDVLEELCSPTDWALVTFPHFHTSYVDVIFARKDSDVYHLI